ncbi:MAG: hypothetical protein WC314_14660 [Vulcanimicrobiota bacterium]
MINPTSFQGIGPLRSAGPLAGANPLANGAANPTLPLGDGGALSPEAQGQDGDLGQMMQALMQAFGMGQDQQPTPEQRIEQLKQEIAQTEQQLAQAQQAGDQESVQGLTQKLEALKAELAQLTGQGQGQEGGTPAGGGGGEAPPAGGGEAGGGGAPSGDGGGAPPAGGGGVPSGDGGGAPPSGGGDNGGGTAPIGGTNGADGGNDTAPLDQTNQVPPELAGDEKKMAEFIESKLNGTPLEGQGLGSHFVAAGKQHGVDPLVLASISKHETNHGKLGVGTRKHMGVGAFDSSPNTPRKWDGAVNQIYSGAKTFSNLRKKFGSNESMPIAHQLQAVNGNGSGWATDKSWHSKVGKAYNNYASSASSFSSSSSSSTPAASTPAKTSSSTPAASTPAKTSSTKKA